MKQLIRQETIIITTGIIVGAILVVGFLYQLPFLYQFPRNRIALLIGPVLGSLFVAIVADYLFRKWENESMDKPVNWGAITIGTLLFAGLFIGLYILGGFFNIGMYSERSFYEFVFFIFVIASFATVISVFLYLSKSSPNMNG